MNAKQKPVAVALSYVRFNNAKTMHAVEATAKQSGAFAQGVELGALTVESELVWHDALRACKAPTDRAMLRAGFVSSYAPLRGVSDKSAANRFDYLARKFAAPETSRQAKANAAKRATGAGRKEKTKGEAKRAEGDATRVKLVLAYVKAAMQSHKGDGEMLDVLGDIARICRTGK